MRKKALVGLLVVAVCFGCGRASDSSRDQPQKPSAALEPADTEPTPLEKLVSALREACTGSFADHCKSLIEEVPSSHDVGQVIQTLGPLCKQDKQGWACLVVAELKHKFGDTTGAREYVVNSCQNLYPDGCRAAGRISKALLEKGEGLPEGNPFDDEETLEKYLGAIFVENSDTGRALLLLQEYCNALDYSMCEIGAVLADLNGDKTLRLTLADIACKNGRPHACNSLGMWLEEVGDVEAAISAYRAGCRGDHHRACTLLAVLLDGRGEASEVLTLFQKSCEAGDAMACIGAGRIVEGEEGEALFKRGCDLGEHRACCVYGLLASQGAQWKTAHAHILKSCSVGVQECCSEAEKIQKRGEFAKRLEDSWRSGGVMARLQEYPCSGSPDAVRVVGKIMESVPPMVRKGEALKVDEYMNGIKTRLSKGFDARDLECIEKIALLDGELFGPKLGVFVYGASRIKKRMGDSSLRPMDKYRMIKEILDVEHENTSLSRKNKRQINEYGQRALIVENMAFAIRVVFYFGCDSSRDLVKLTNRIGGVAADGILERDPAKAERLLIDFWLEVSSYQLAERLN